jgi:cysteinyl-tRNA synthetase
MTEKKEEVSPRDGSTFRMFACGPTVQDNVHLGHAKTYIAFDVLARWLLKSGFKVQFLVNITDIDDKIFDRAKKENVPFMALADHFLKDFLSDIDALNIVTISKVERVSNYVEEAISLVEILLRKGVGYQNDGNTYFDISRAKHFGKLSHLSGYQLKLKQIDAAPGKRNSVDFLLWRKTPEVGEGAWNSSLGRGRPGWHIEDTAIALSQFRTPYDLHGGATELIFPHHEAELAQDEALTGEIPFVSHWMHTGLLLKDGEKMSKSLGNVVKIQDALRDYSADEIRLYFLKRHYRDSFDLDMEMLAKAKLEIEPLLKAASRLPKDTGSGNELKALVDRETFRQFGQSMDDDLNTPKALQILLQVAAEINENSSSRGDRPKSGLSPLFWHMVESLGFRLF